MRSPAAEERSELGHIEVDLMIFSHTKKVLAVFVDRCTRKTWAYINEDKIASVMADTMREFLCDASIAYVKSLLFDNGTENFYHHIVRDEFGTFDIFYTFFVILTLLGKKVLLKILINFLDSIYLVILSLIYLTIIIFERLFLN